MLSKQWETTLKAGCQLLQLFGAEAEPIVLGLLNTSLALEKDAQTYHLYTGKRARIEKLNWRDLNRDLQILTELELLSEIDDLIKLAAGGINQYLITQRCGPTSKAPLEALFPGDFDKVSTLELLTRLVVRLK